jgi:hypothetical protein
MTCFAASILRRARNIKLSAMQNALLPEIIFDGDFIVHLRDCEKLLLESHGNAIYFEFIDLTY